LKINWALGEDTSPYQEMYNELKRKRRALTVTHGHQRILENSVASTALGREVPLYYYYY